MLGGSPPLVLRGKGGDHRMLGGSPPLVLRGKGSGSQRAAGIRILWGWKRLALFSHGWEI